MIRKTLITILIGSFATQLFVLPAQADELAFAQCSEYINVRQEPDIESAVVGKVYNNCAVTVLDEYEGWYHIHSGNVEGYVAGMYFVKGADAWSVAENVAYDVATVCPEALTVRASATEDSDAIGTVYAGDELAIVSYDGDWMLVNINGMYGYVNAYYVGYNTYYPVAETLDEEAYRLAQESYDAPPAIPEQTHDWWEQSDNYYYEQEEDNYYYDPDVEDFVTEDNSDYYYDADTQEYVYEDLVIEDEDDIIIEDETAYSDGQYLVDYAMQFVGNPYVWGGTSLTDGADCSGFTQSVFADNGIYIPRTAAEQSAYGTQVSTDELLPGDLLFYSSGAGIDHVSIYAGNGQVIHASSPSTGITVSDYGYRIPLCAVRYW